MFEDYSEVLCISQIRQMLGGSKPIGKNTAYQYIKKNEIPYMKIGREYRVLKKDIIEHLEHNKLCYNSQRNQCELPKKGDSNGLKSIEQLTN